MLHICHEVNLDQEIFKLEPHGFTSNAAFLILLVMNHRYECFLSAQW